MKQWFAVIPFLFSVMFSPVLAGSSDKISPAYHLYVGFTAEASCVPADGPYLTKLSLDAAFRDLHFGFGRRDADSERMDWWLAAGPAATLPIYVVFGEGTITAHELCAHTKCNKRIVGARFTKEDTTFQPLLAVVPAGDAAKLDDVLEPAGLKGLSEALVPLTKCVFECKLVCRGALTWTHDCAVRGQDVGNLYDLEFSFSLPVAALLQGKALTFEFPFIHDDFDVPGKLTVRFIPVSSR